MSYWGDISDTLPLLAMQSNGGIGVLSIGGPFGMGMGGGQLAIMGSNVGSIGLLNLINASQGSGNGIAITLHGMDGSEVSISRASENDRDCRLNSKVRTLYHQTSYENWSKSRSDGKMLRGSGGLAGGGIYFAESPSETNNKAHSHGIILQARVRLGNHKTIDSNGDSSITFSNLLREGYDSVFIPRSGGDEWVVYNHDQVSDIRPV